MKNKFMAILLILCLLLPLCSNAMAAAVAVKSLTIKGGNATLKIGQTKQLTVSITPGNASDKKITWKSSNAKVAAVSSSGLVTAKSAGKATITATASNGKKCTTTMTVAKQPSVTKVKLNMTKMSMLGKPVKLKATCLPSGSSQAVSWSSSKTSVATVTKDGIVTPKGYGTCKITAKSGNGKTATCTVTVSKDRYVTATHDVLNYKIKVPVNKLTLIPSVLSLLKGKNGGKNVDIFQIRCTEEMTLIVDGLTGKVKKAFCKSYSSREGLGVLFSISTKKEDSEMINKQDTYADFKFTHVLSSSMFLPLKKIGIDLGVGSDSTFVLTWRLDNSGKLTPLSYRCY